MSVYTSGGEERSDASELATWANPHAASLPANVPTFRCSETAACV